MSTLTLSRSIKVALAFLTICLYGASFAGYGDPPPPPGPECFGYASSQCDHPLEVRGCISGSFTDLTDYTNSLGYVTHFVWSCEDEGKSVLCTVPRAPNCRSDVDVTTTFSYSCGDPAMKIGASIFPESERENLTIEIDGVSVTTGKTFVKTIGINKAGNGYASVVYTNKASNNYVPNDTYNLVVRTIYNGQPTSVFDTNGNKVPQLEIKNLKITNECANLIPGCMDRLAKNFNSKATVSDKSCTYDAGVIFGCTSKLAKNYSAFANKDDGSCIYDTLPPYDLPGETPIADVTPGQNDTTIDTGVPQKPTDNRPTTGDPVITTSTNPQPDKVNPPTSTPPTNTNTQPPKDAQDSPNPGDPTKKEPTQKYTDADVVAYFIDCDEEPDNNPNNGCVEERDVASSLVERGILKALPEGVKPTDIIMVARNNTCGDNVIYTDVEACDNGEQNANSKSCTLSCTLAVCGDGEIYDQDGGSEQCDGGKNCDASCQLSENDLVRIDTNTLNTDLDAAPAEKGPLGKFFAALKGMYDQLPGVVKLVINIAGILVLGLIAGVVYGMLSRRVDHHIVKVGETLESIALAYGTTDRRIRNLNRKGHSWIPAVGKSIKVPNRHFTEKNSLDQLKEVLADGLGTKLGNHGKNKAWGKGNTAKKEQAKMDETVRLATKIGENAGLFEQMAQEQHIHQEGDKES